MHYCPFENVSSLKRTFMYTLLLQQLVEFIWLIKFIYRVVKPRGRGLGWGSLVECAEKLGKPTREFVQTETPGAEIIIIIFVYNN